MTHDFAARVGVFEVTHAGDAPVRGAVLGGGAHGGDARECVGDRGGELRCGCGDNATMLASLGDARFV